MGRWGPGGPIPFAAFESLCEREPRLRQLYEEAKAIKDSRRTRSFCANAIFFGYGEDGRRGFKPRLSELVGWAGENPELRTREAYDIAYRTIYDALPDCRNCLCG